MGCKNVLSFDINNSVCTAVLCTYNDYDNTAEFKEIHKFRNSAVVVHGHKYRDILNIFTNIKRAVSKASEQTEGNLENISISACGIEFGLLDKYGYLIQNPFCYDDSHIENMTEKVLRFIKKDDIFSTTGADLCRYSSIVHIMAENDTRPYILEQAYTFLMLPDLIGYMLTGKKYTEYTNAFSSQLINCEKYDWSGKIISMLGLKRNIFPEIVYNEYYDLLPEICDELKCKPVKIKTSGSAISNISVILEKYPDSVIIDSDNDTKICIHSDKPVLSKSASEFNVINTGTYDKKFMIMHSENGINLIDDTIRCFTERGISCNYSKLENTACSSEPLKCFINTELDILKNNDNIPITIQNYCRDTNQYVPQNVSEMVRCLYESIAFRYAMTIEKLARICGKEYTSICMTGKDSKNAVICQTLANVCKVNVISGIEKASLYGNIALQLKNENSDIKKILSAIMPDENFKIYTPEQNSKAPEAYQTFSTSF